MIKRIIFDLDNTLFEWSDEYKEKEKIFLKNSKYNFNDVFLETKDQLLDDYEAEHLKYQKQDLLDYFYLKTKTKLDLEFFNEWFEINRYFVPKDVSNIENTLKYLKTKYDLAILTNFFEECQINRLKQCGLLRYFSDVYGGEQYLKPAKESFLRACGNFKPNECIMIGDDIIKDIEGALKCRLKAIYIGNKEPLICDKITKIEELKKIL